MSRIQSTGFGKLACAVEKISTQDKEKAFYEVYKILKNKFPNVVNEEHLEKLNSRGDIYYSKIWMKDNNLNSKTICQGYYHLKTSDIHLNSKMNINNISRTFLHESVHKICIPFEEKIHNKYFEEGVTEYIVKECLGKSKSSLSPNNLLVNFDEAVSYFNAVAIVSQMQIMVDDDDLLIKSFLNANKDFEEKFIKLYGKENWKYFNSELKNCERKNDSTDLIGLQNALLVRTTIKRMENAKGKDDYINILKMLQKLQNRRVRKLFAESSDPFYRDYYNSIYSSIFEKFERNNFNTQELKKYQYKKEAFYGIDDAILKKTYIENIKRLFEKIDMNLEKVDKFVCNKFTDVRDEEILETYEADGKYVGARIANEKIKKIEKSEITDERIINHINKLKVKNILAIDNKYIIIHEDGVIYSRNINYRTEIITHEDIMEDQRRYGIEKVEVNSCIRGFSSLQYMILRIINENKNKLKNTISNFCIYKPANVSACLREKNNTNVNDIKETLKVANFKDLVLSNTKKKEKCIEEREKY